MNVISVLVVGLLAGILARFIMPGKDSLGLVATVLLGIAGSFVGSLVGQTMGWGSPGEPVDLIGSVLGALLILFIARLAAKR